MNIILAMLIGLFGGLTSGLFGLGGGSVFVPLLVFVLGFDIHLAIGTSLAVVIPTALIGVLKNQSAHMIDWKTVVLLVALSMIGAWVGATLSLKMNSLLLKRLFACILILIALRLFFSK